ncbi:hypothetical protein [Kitasatospora sp. NPDC127116]|uniref:hypothetical protein n=1 Tax=Kitasatospora sp. NPDC127116 TaxID=3345367 RepID=UPI0036290C86
MRFAFTITVTDRGRVVETVDGETVIDGHRSHDQICRTLIDGLPQHLRRPGYGFGVQLTRI